MSTTRTTRVAGLLGAFGGVALVILAALQMAGRLSDAADDVLSTIGFVGMAAVLLALLRVGAAPTRLGRAGLVIWIVGVLAIPAGGLVGAAWLFPIGGIGQTVGGLIAGISIARAGVLEGWVRWAPLAWATVYTALVPFGFTESAAFSAMFALFGATVTVTSLGVAGARVRVGDARRASVAATS